MSASFAKTIESLSCVFTVSSAALVTLGLCIALMVMNEVQRLTRLPIIVIAFIYFVLAFAAVSAVSESGPLSVFRRYVLLDSGSAVYREYIWEYAGAEALNHPMFGIGLRDWERPFWMGDSVDSFWLVSAMMFGYPLAVAAFLTMAGTITVLALRCSRAPEDIRRIAFAIATSLSVIVFSGFTVHLWEGVAGWMLLMTGAAVTLSQWRDQIAPQHRMMKPPLRKPMPRADRRTHAAMPVRRTRRPR